MGQLWDESKALPCFCMTHVDIKFMEIYFPSGRLSAGIVAFDLQSLKIFYVVVCRKFVEPTHTISSKNGGLNLI